jgi:hypothetical protein
VKKLEKEFHSYLCRLCRLELLLRRVTQYIDEKVAQGIARSDAGDVADWQFVRTLTPSSSVDLVTDTQRLFKQLKGYRSDPDPSQRVGGNP